LPQFHYRDCGFSILSIISDCILTYNVVNLLKKSKNIAQFVRIVP